MKDKLLKFKVGLLEWVGLLLLILLTYSQWFINVFLLAVAICWLLSF